MLKIIIPACAFVERVWEQGWLGWCRCCGVAASEKKVEEVPDTWRRLQTQHYNGGLELMYYFKNIIYDYLIKIQLYYKDLTNYHEFVMLEKNYSFPYA